VDLQAGDVSRQAGQQAGHEARARPDFQHAVGGLKAQFLQHARLHPGLQHARTLRRAVDQGHLGVHESQRLMGLGDEVFPAHTRQQRQHPRLEHIPGADLLLDHVEAGLLDVHGAAGGVRGGRECGEDVRSARERPRDTTSVGF